MELIEINATKRTKTGKGPAGALRRGGMIPAMLYGRGTQTQMLTINAGQFEKALRDCAGMNAVFNLMVQNDDAAGHKVMIKELQTHPLSRQCLHVDFYEIDVNRKIRADVPVVTTGTSKGVELGGMLQIIRHELEVLALPFDIPEAITIDITDLDVGDAVHVDEIALKENVEIQAETNFTVLTILSPTMEAELEAEAEEEAEAEIEEEQAQEGAVEPEADA